MPRRIDVLADTPSRTALFPAPMLDTREDPVLQGLVREAADRLGAPIALVSLVLDRIQFFRAQVGLPSDLAAMQATDRDISFCQFVVQDDQLFAVEDATVDPRVPQVLVASHGVRSYLGAPVRVHDAVLGSLCVIDGVARTFSAADRALLEGLAGRASARCAELVAAAESARLAHQVSATQDAFPELRNQLLVLQSGIAEARYERAQVAPALRAATIGSADPQLLQEAVGAMRALDDRLTETARAADLIQAQVVALEAVLEKRYQPADIGAALDRAGALARHLTKLLAGVDLPLPAPHPPLRASQATTVAVLTNVLREVGWRALEAGGAPVRVRVTRHDHPDHVCIRVQTPGLVGAALDGAAKAVAFDAGGREGVSVGHDGAALETRFTLR